MARTAIAHPEDEAGAPVPINRVFVSAASVAGHGAFTNSHPVFSSSFEAGQPLPSMHQFLISTTKARTGLRSLVGTDANGVAASSCEIPIHAAPDKTFRISFSILANNRSTCQVVLRKPSGPINLFWTSSLPNNWTNITVDCTTRFRGDATIVIIASSPKGAVADDLWIDDLSVTENVPMQYEDHAVQFPALTTDSLGRVWMAVLERPLPRRVIRVYRLENGQPMLVATLEPAGLTGIAPPAIAPWGRGCLVAFPIEQSDQWQIAYSFVDDQPGTPPVCEKIESNAAINISPSIAVAGTRAWIAWESNGGTTRGICTCWVNPAAHGPIQRVSAGNFNSYNPAIVSLPGGSLFAAWDSIHGTNANIYGAWYRSGSWEPEQRMTSDMRIERHPALAALSNQVWMAWQAQSYTNLAVNEFSEQRIAVARVDTGKLMAPERLFNNVSKVETLMQRPQIGFDPDGRLWLTTRQSISLHAGWQPVAWWYTGQRWSPPQTLMIQQGRWQPVSITWTPSGGWAAVQFDDLPAGWIDREVHSNWNSGVTLVALPQPSPALPLITTALMMPTPTNFFSLDEKRALISAEFPRQQISHAGQNLTLFWGDFHEHTDLSVCNRALNPPGHDLFANERDIEKLDFMALTDHDYHFDVPQWQYNGEQTRCNHDEGRFVTFLGHEWTSSENPPAQPGGFARYGHRNLVFLDPYHPTFYNSYSGDISPADLWNQLGAAEFLCIPHALADWELKGVSNPPTDWSFVDPIRQPVAEIYQHRGSYEYLGCPLWATNGAPFTGNYMQDAWAKHIIIGVIASPDHGGGFGKAGVWAQDLTRESIFEAIRARHTFGTSGPKMSLFFGTGNAMMGDKVSRATNDPISFHVTAKAWREINEVVIFRNNQIVFRTVPGSKNVDLNWTDPHPPPPDDFLWYYARIQAVDTQLAWSSPIWFLKP